MKAVFKSAAPYADDAMNLPVRDVDAAVPYYEKGFGSRVVSRQDAPHRSSILARDNIQIGLAENGGDPTQEGCFFEVDNVEAPTKKSRARRQRRPRFGWTKWAASPTAFSSKSLRTVSATCWANAGSSQPCQRRRTG